MKKFRTQINRSPRRRGRNPLITKTTALTKLAVGSLMSIPFIVDVFVMRHGYHSEVLIPTLLVLGFVIGGMFAFVGLIQLTVASGGKGSNASVDLARIRIAAEKTAGRNI